MSDKDLAMVRKASDYHNMSTVLKITLIALVLIMSILTSCFFQSNFGANTYTIINQMTKQSSLPTNLTELNEINSLNITNSYFSNFSASLGTESVSLDTLKPSYKPPDQHLSFFSLPYNFYTSLNTEPISLDSSKFVTYTYSGYSVQQPDSTQFIFSFPENISEGQIAGSDILTLDAYPIRTIDFDAIFISQKINALGFDEMVIFATSDASTYKGVEFGIRLDLCDGFIYGYNQEPNGNIGEVNFQMMQLTPNDGIMHHYTLIIVNSEVSFYINGIYHGCLSFPSNTDYSNFTFFILAVVHRFTDGWDSVGNNMMVENFYLSQMQ
jgi:hypothetical protein